MKFLNSPSQKSPIPLNRYDDFVDDLSYRSRSQEQTPEPRLVARALYNFVGQTPRELTFRRNDLIFVRRQVDKNWYEGEHNAMVGLFPFNYVEVIHSLSCVGMVAFARCMLVSFTARIRLFSRKIRGFSGKSNFNKIFFIFSTDHPLR